MQDSNSRMVRAAASAMVAVVVCLASCAALRAQADNSVSRRTSMNDMKLSAEHIAAVNHPRRIIAHYDVTGGSMHWAEALEGERLELMLKSKFDFVDMPGSQIDSIFWDLGTDVALFASEVRPVARGWQKWVDAGLDILGMFLEEGSKRGLENFYSYRMNEFDADMAGTYAVPMKAAHPEWVHQAFEPPDRPGYWNYAIPGVRAYHLRALREVAEKYDYDGIQVDFGRTTVSFPRGEQWVNRHHMTEFMRSLRAVLLDVEEKRRRPFLLAAKVPENIEGCHFDGLDVETWAREQLVDIFVLGIRALDVDVEAFRRIAAGTHIKLYPCLDDGHSSDGYKNPEIALWRGLCSNYWQQGADGICAFNMILTSPEAAARANFMQPPWVWKTHRQVHLEVGSPETLKHKANIFPVERRGGGHWMIAKPEDWRTPRYFYFNTNMFAPLPAKLASDGKADTLLWIRVADNVAAEADQIEQLTVRVLLSDPAAERLPQTERLERALISHKYRLLYNTPPAKGIEDHIELRVNNILLPRPTIAGWARELPEDGRLVSGEGGWLEFPAEPNSFAVGKNLIGIRVADRPPDTQAEISIEKLEVHVKYR